MSRIFARRLPAQLWFGLTANERLALGVVLGLFLLGLGWRVWQQRGPEAGRAEAAPPAKTLFPTAR